MGQALGHARVPEGFVHKDQGQHLQQPILDVLLQLGNLAAQVVEHCGEGRAEGKESGHMCARAGCPCRAGEQTALPAQQGGLRPLHCLVFKE